MRDGSSNNEDTSTNRRTNPKEDEFEESEATHKVFLRFGEISIIGERFPPVGRGTEGGEERRLRCVRYGWNRNEWDFVAFSSHNGDGV